MLINNSHGAFDLSSKLEGQDYFDVCQCLSFSSQDLPKRNSNFLTIVGSSGDVQKEVTKWGLHGDVFVTNFVGLFLNSQFQHMASFHADIFKHIIELKKLAISFNKFSIHTFGEINSRVRSNLSYIDFIWKFYPKPRSSGLLSLWIGLALGYKKIMLLGIPLDNSGRFTDIEKDTTRDLYYSETIEICKSKVDFSKFTNVRSASGETKKIFGEPSWDWIQKESN